MIVTYNAFETTYYQDQVFRIPHQGFTEDFIIFHRPLSTYWKAFKQAGFHVIEFNEPYIKEELKSEISPILLEKFEARLRSVAFLIKRPY